MHWEVSSWGWGDHVGQKRQLVGKKGDTDTSPFSLRSETLDFWDVWTVLSWPETCPLQTSCISNHHAKSKENDTRSNKKKTFPIPSIQFYIFLINKIRCKNGNLKTWKSLFVSFFLQTCTAIINLMLPFSYLINRTNVILCIHTNTELEGIWYNAISNKVIKSAKMYLHNEIEIFTI